MTMLFWSMTALCGVSGFTYTLTSDPPTGATWEIAASIWALVAVVSDPQRRTP